MDAEPPFFGLRSEAWIEGQGKEFGGWLICVKN